MPALSQILLAATSPRLERDTEKGLGPAEGAREAMGRVRPARIARWPELVRRGCGAVGAEGRRCGLWSRPPGMMETVAGSGAEVSERASLPRSSWGRGPRQTKSQALGFSFVMRGQWGGGGWRSGRAGSLSCYLFSMFCICKLREVKLASRSVTSSTCGMKPRLCYGVPPGPPSSTTGMEGRHSLSPQGMWWLHRD